MVLLSVTGFLWILFVSCNAWRDTGINMLRWNAGRLASVGGVGILFGAAFWALGVKQRGAAEGQQKDGGAAKGVKRK